MGTINVEGVEYEFDGSTPSPQDLRRISSLASPSEPTAPPALPTAEEPPVATPSSRSQVQQLLGQQIQFAPSPDLQALRYDPVPIEESDFIDRTRAAVMATEAGLTEGLSEALSFATSPLSNSVSKGLAGAARQQRQEQQRLAAGTTSFEDALAAAGEGDPSGLISFAGEQGIAAIPGLLLALKAAPAYVASSSGSIAAERAARRGAAGGDPSVTLSDYAIALPAAAASLFTERLAGRAYTAPQAGSVAGGAIRGAAGELATEPLQTAVESVAGQIGTSDDPSLLMGVDPREVGMNVLASALPGAALGGAGGGLSTAAALRQRDTRTASAELEAAQQELADERLMLEAERSARGMTETDVEVPVPEPRQLRQRRVRDTTDVDVPLPTVEDISVQRDRPGLRRRRFRDTTEQEIPLPTVEDLDLPSRIAQAQELGERRSSAPFGDTVPDVPVYQFGATDPDLAIASTLPDIPALPGPMTERDIPLQRSFQQAAQDTEVDQPLQDRFKPDTQVDTSLQQAFAPTDPDLDITPLVTVRQRRQFQKRSEDLALGKPVDVDPLEGGIPLAQDVPAADPGSDIDRPDTPAPAVDRPAPAAERVTPKPDAQALGRAGVQAVDPRAKPSDVVPDVMDYVASTLTPGVAMQEGSIDKDVQPAFDRLGIDSSRKKHRVGYAEAIRQLEQQGYQRTEPNGDVVFSEKTVQLMDDMAKPGYAPSAIELMAAFSYYNHSIKRSEKNLELADRLIKRGGAEAALETNLKNIRARIDKSDNDARKAYNAIRSGRSEAGRALKYLQFEVDRDMNLQSAMVKAAVRKGKPLTEQEKGRLSKTWTESEKKEKQQQVVRSKIKKKLDKKDKDVKALEDKVSAAESRVSELDDQIELVNAETRQLIKRFKEPRSRKKIQQKAQQRIRKIKDRQSDIQKTLTSQTKKRNSAIQERDTLLNKMLEAEAEIRSAKVSRDLGIGRALNPYRSKLSDLVGKSVALKASFDISGPGRQGIILGVQDPAFFIKTIPVAAKLLTSRTGRAKAAQIMDDILGNEMQSVRDSAGLQLTEAEGRSSGGAGPLGIKEEIMMDRVSGSGFLGQALAPSNNAYAVSLNLIRSNAFDKGAKAMAELRGVKDPTPDQIRDVVPAEDLRLLAEFVNTSTGRGTWNPAQSLGTLRKIFFAPRFTLSRIETPKRMLEILFGAGRYKNMSPEGLKYLQSQIHKNVGVVASMGFLSALAGSGYEEEEDESVVFKRMQDFIDPRSSRFLKLSVGDTAVDLLGGIPSTVRYLVPSAYKIIDDFMEDRSSQPEFIRRATKFATYKFNPILRGAFSVIFGGDYAGRPLTPPEEEQVQLARDSSLYKFLRYRAIPAMTSAVAPINLETLGRGLVDYTKAEGFDDEMDAISNAGATLLGDMIGLSTTVYEDDPTSPDKQIKTVRPTTSPFEFAD